MYSVFTLSIVFARNLNLMLLPLLWMLFLVSGNLANAADSAPEKTPCPIEDSVANNLLHQAKTITRADHNPGTRDYIMAAQLYTEAANQYELRLAQLSHPPAGTPEAQLCYAAALDQLADRIAQIRFTAYQTENMARYRVRRGLL